MSEQLERVSETGISRERVRVTSSPIRLYDADGNELDSSLGKYQFFEVIPEVGRPPVGLPERGTLRVESIEMAELSFHKSGTSGYARITELKKYSTSVCENPKTPLEAFL